MKKNLPLIIVALVLAIVAGVVYWTNSGSGTLGDAAKEFAIEDTASVTKIFLADKTGNKSLLERQENGSWLLNGKYLARQDAINTLLKTMKNLEVQSPVGKNARNTVITDMSARGVKVEVYTSYKSDPDKVYYVGGATMNNMGTYMLIEDAEMPYIMHIPGFTGYLSTRYFTEESKWRSTTIFSSDITEITSVKMEYSAKPESSFEIVLGGDKDVSLIDLNYNSKVENFDTAAVWQYLSSFRKVNFEAIENLAVEKIDSILGTPVIFKVSLKDREGHETYLKAYRKRSRYKEGAITEGESEFDVDRMYANINDEKEIVLIQFFVFDRLLRELQYFETDPQMPKANELGS